jgi:deoxyribonuclease V
MEVGELHPWPATVAEAEAIQDRLRPLVHSTVCSTGPSEFGLVAGVDVAYAKDSDLLAAAVVVLDAATLEVVDSATAVGRVAFEYVPGLFAFRELPTLVDALQRLTTTPDLLVCDGQGIAHPRRFGLACHLGVLTGLPSIGAAKTVLVGTFEPPADRRGSESPMWHDGEVVGRAVRTRAGVKPVYVSVGHRIDLDTACRTVCALSTAYRLPETTRQADRLCRQALTDREGRPL